MSLYINIWLQMKLSYAFEVVFSYKLYYLLLH